jgi:hypothetical protein
MHGEVERSSLPFQKTIVIGVAALLVIWAGYMVYRVFSRSDAPPQVAVTEAAPEAQQSPAETEEQASPGPEQNLSPEPEPEKRAADQPKPAAEATAPVRGGPLEAPQGLRLTVRGLEPTWVRLSVDRAPPVEVRVEPADTLNWEANEEIRLVIGKSHGVAVYLNGEDVLLPAERNRLIPSIVLNKLTLLRLEN